MTKKKKKKKKKKTEQLYKVDSNRETKLQIS